MRKLLSSWVLALLVGATPVVVMLAPSSAQAQGIRLQIAPPAPRIEVIPAAPSPRHVWIGGHWGWNGARHVWVGGFYDLPPHRGYSWNPAHWVNEGGYWVFRQGHWGPTYEEPVVTQPQPEEYVSPAQPPPPQEEIVPPAPGYGQVWIPGYQRWDPMVRQYAWSPGHYRMGEPGRRWSPAHWGRTWRGWEFRQGHWR